jgi:hypothetical protein
MTDLYAFRIREMTTEIWESAPSFAAEVEWYEAVPSVFLAKTDGEGAARIGKLDGVIGFEQTAEANRRIIYSIDSLLRTSKAHRETLRLNGVLKAYVGADICEGGPPPYPYWDRTSAPPILRYDSDVRLDTRLCIFGALNLSIQPEPPKSHSDGDPACIAIRTASADVSVVIAAGNKFDANTGQLIGGWAEEPCAIVVGATSDSKGEVLADYSLVGGRDGQPRGPTVVAYGRDDETSVEGTSFAAPRVADELAVLTAFALTIRHFVHLGSGAPLEGIPLVGIGYVDIDLLPGRGAEHGWHVSGLRRPEKPVPALPRAGIDADAVFRVLRLLDKHGVPLKHRRVPDFLKEMLVTSARAIPAYDASEVGAGFIDKTTTAEYLASYSGLDYARTLLGFDVLSEAGKRSLAEIQVADRDLLVPMIDVWRTSVLKWGADLRDFKDRVRDQVQVLA